MADTKYTVELELTKHGDFGLDVAVKKTAALDKGMQNVKGGWDDLRKASNRFMDSLDGIANKALSVTKNLAMGGAAAAIGGITYGVMSLNAQAEGAAMSMGAIFAANGVAASVPKGITMAKDTIGQMRLDAQKLPGEFEDLQRIFVTGATSALQGGASIDEWRGISAKAMAAGFVTQMPLDQVARELTALLEGHAGGQNTFGSKLGLTGDKAKAFNKLDKAGRRKEVAAELDKYAGAIDIFGGSWEGLTSTMVDGLKNFGRVATGGIFERLKDTLGQINKWFGDNQEEIGAFAEQLGLKLVVAFDWGKNKILEWYPIVERFAKVAFDRLSKFWKDIEPYVAKFAEAMKDALSDPEGTLDKLVTALKMYGALKAGGGLVKGVSEGITIVKALNTLKKGGLAGLLGTSTIGTAVTTALTTAAPFAAAAAIPAAAAGGLYYGAFGGVKSQVEHDDESTVRGVTLADEKWRMMAEAGASSSYILEAMNKDVEALNASFQSVTAAAYKVEMALLAEQAGVGDSKQDAMMDQAYQAFRAVNSMVMAGGTWAKPEEKKDKDKPKVPGGMGGTNIQKVEIVVTSNGDPSRIARIVEQKLSGIQRIPRASGLAPNYSLKERR